MNLESLLKWFEKEKVKDQNELNHHKSIQIQEIKNLKKEDLFCYKEKKLTIWQRLKKTLMGS